MTQHEGEPWLLQNNGAGYTIPWHALMSAFNSKDTLRLNQQAPVTNGHWHILDVQFQFRFMSITENETPTVPRHVS